MQRVTIKLRQPAEGDADRLIFGLIAHGFDVDSVSLGDSVNIEARKFESPIEREAFNQDAGKAEVCHGGD